MFPVGKLNSYEIEVLDTEMSRSGAVSWYPNPTGGRGSMSIAYQDRHGEWRTLRPELDGTTAHRLIARLTARAVSLGRVSTGNSWNDRTEDTWIDKL